MKNPQITQISVPGLDTVLQYLQPAARVLFGLGAVLQHSHTPSLRVAGFEDEDENEAPCEINASFWLGHIFRNRGHDLNPKPKSA